MKSRRIYVCQSCGHQESKWMGRCPSCSAWSSLVEEEISEGPKKRDSSASQAVSLSQITCQSDFRFSTGITELDRVLGGGLVQGALVLVGGDPGIGKSTLLLQALGYMAEHSGPCLYVTAEESLTQVKMRADRLGISPQNLYLLSETDIDHVEQIRCDLKPHVLVIDSIQTVGLSHMESAVGSVGQIRAVTQRLLEVAKGQGASIFVVGHVTKEGAIAGPKVMEHMVDTVLYFEGEKTGSYRILRAHKNRFGSSQEIGVFEMQSDGLKPISNPSEVFLSQRAQGPGSVVVTSLEGTRPILLEVQALVAPCLYGAPRRITVGFDPQRVAVLCAVLERWASLEVANLDVYVNIAGGVRVNETATDLGVALALASTLRNKPVPMDCVVMGEVGLSGEIRAISQLSMRVREAMQLGFSWCVVPKIDLDRLQDPKTLLPLKGAAYLHEALKAVGLED